LELVEKLLFKGGKNKGKQSKAKQSKGKQSKGVRKGSRILNFYFKY
jgi:hypothetical protein